VRGLVTDASGNLWIRLEGPRMLLYHDGKFEDTYTRFDLQDITFTATASWSARSFVPVGVLV
jgi:hypothetical protein